MANKAERFTLAEHVSRPEMLELVQKNPADGYEVVMSQFLPVGFWLFGKGALFGRARKDKLNVIAEMFVGVEAINVLFSYHKFPEGAASDVKWVFEFLMKVASDGLNYYRGCRRREPDSLLDLWLTSWAPDDYDFRKIENTIELSKKKIRLGFALRHLDEWFFTGISLGANFPDLTERLWRKYYEKVDQESWTRARNAGIDIPQNPTPVPLEVVENEILGEVASYTKQNFSELVDLLDLRSR